MSVLLQIGGEVGEGGFTFKKIKPAIKTGGRGMEEEKARKSPFVHLRPEPENIGPGWA